MGVKIVKETLKDGTVRWRARGVSTGTDPVTGRRTQRTITGKTKKEVESAVRRIGVAVDNGTYARPWDGTVADVLDDYLKTAGFERAANTRLSYEKALLPARERLGAYKARSVTRADVEELRDWMLTSGRRRGGQAGTGLGARSVRLTIGRLSAAFEQACRDNRLAANPCQYVRLPAQERREGTTWSGEQMKAFLNAASGTRLSAAWWLTALGLRRGEVLGLKWSDIDLNARTVTVRRSRVLVDYQVIEKSTKSVRGTRTLPVPVIGDGDKVIAALRALRDLQAIEAIDAENAYDASGYVVCDELGRPVHPEWYSDEFARICTDAHLPRIRLHDSRHTINSLMAAAGVPVHIRAAWCGQTEAVNEGTYTHARPEDMTAASGIIGGLL
jgi:integrase